MLKIVCVRTGEKYGPEYVNILSDMVRRNLRAGMEGRFICFTDNPEGLDCETYLLPEKYAAWWGKLHLFKSGVFEEGDRVVYFDLDTVITGWLDDLVTYQGEFAICRDFYHPTRWNSSVMMWRGGFGAHIYDEWIRQGRPDIPGGDQEWIELQQKQADLIQDLFPGSVLSYKVDCTLQYPPQGTKIVCFHGEPKPDNCAQDWVALIWKVGGGSAAELEMMCNTAEERLITNIRHAVSLGHPDLEFLDAHDGHAVIVGGGPSLRGRLEEIAARQKLGQTVIALNGSYRWLKSRGIQPDWHVMLDARPENADFVMDSPRHFLASQCDKAVFDKAENVTLWHAQIHGIEHVVDAPVWINAGTTVGLSAMAIAYTQGYRKLHLYGFDSSYGEDHHVYPQALNDKDAVMDVVCQGKGFRAAPWMVAQANQFPVVCDDLVRAGCVVTVHGEGLLPWVAKQMEFSSEPDTMAVEIDGEWWPSKDSMARLYIHNAMGDIDTILAHVKGRECVVQAGGNVGIWPREFKKHFKRVVTFEPDKLNFECLQKNAPGVEAYNCAIGAEPGKATLARDPSNCGAHSIEEGEEFEIFTLDSMKISHCDLLQLDIEGFEWQALKGAEDLIKRCKPVIVVELKNHGSKYGYTDQDLIDWLKARGYQEKARFGRDVLFSPLGTTSKGT